MVLETLGATCVAGAPFPVFFEDDTTAVQGERGGKLAWPSLSRSPQSPLLLNCNGKGTKKRLPLQ